jgi:hypothetical protein
VSDRFTGADILRRIDEPVRRIAWSRKEIEPCEAGTPGCCIDHRLDNGGCTTW